MPSPLFLMRRALLCYSTWRLCLGVQVRIGGMKKCFKYFISQQVYKNVHIISLHKFCIKQLHVNFTLIFLQKIHIKLYQGAVFVKFVIRTTSDYNVSEFHYIFFQNCMYNFSEVFEKFLRAYIERFKQQSIDSDQWKDFLYSYFQDKVH